MTEELDKLEEILNSYEQDKSNLMDKLIERMFSSDNETFISNIGSFLIDNFRDEKIEQCFLSLIKEPKWKGKNETFLHLLSKYTSGENNLYFLVDLLMNNIHESDGKIFQDGYNMIVDMQPSHKKKEIIKSVERLEQELTKTTDDKGLKLIESLIYFLNKQIEIADFYAEYELEEELEKE